jgi:Tfp pilus assembly protein PilF
VRTNDYKTAIAEYKAVVEKAPNIAEVWIRLGDVYKRTGDLQSAESHFKKAQQLVPNNITPTMQLALLYEASGRRADSKPYYEQVLRVDPDNAIALNNLAFMMAEAGSDLDQALTMAQRARQRLPNDNLVADTLGWIYIKKNLSDTAIGIFKDLVQKEPDRATFQYHLAMALYQKGDKAEARRYCEQALRSRMEKDEERQIRELLSKLS